MIESWASFHLEDFRPNPSVGRALPRLGPVSEVCELWEPSETQEDAIERRGQRMHHKCHKGSLSAFIDLLVSEKL